MLPRLKTTIANYSLALNFIIFNTDDETDSKHIHERKFWISVEGTVKS
jgi:hypothetical protein